MPVTSIVFVAVTYQRSGMEQVVVDLCSRAALDGAKVSVLVPSGVALDGFAEEIIACGANVVRVGELFSTQRSAIANLWAIWRTLRRLRPDIVHVHVPWAPSGWEVIVGAWLARIPIRLRTEHNPVPHRLPHRQRFKLRILDALVTGVVFVSQGNRASHRSNGGRTRGRQFVIGNGVPIHYLTPEIRENARRSVLQLTGAPDDAPHAVMVATLGLRKGPLDFVDAARVASELHPVLHFVVIGDGPERANAEAAACAAKLSSRIHFLGRRADVIALLPGFDVYVQPSHYEGMSLAMLEALHAGLPMATTRVDGVADILGEDPACEIVDVGDTPALGRAIARLANDPALRSNHASVSLAAVQRGFSREAMLDQYTQLYAQLVRSR